MTPTEHPGLRVTDDGPVRTVTLCNPAERNAQTPSLWGALRRAAEATARHTRVVVIDAEGSSFSAGLHLRMLEPEGMPEEPNLLALAGQDADRLLEAVAGFQTGFTAWRTLPAIVVAAVQGHAVGAGFQLALAADVRLLADDAQLAMRETSLGLVPDLGGTAPLVHLVGYSRALEICATGRFVGAAEAVRIGLASLAVPRADLAASTADLVGALLATPEEALRELKALLCHAAGDAAGAAVGAGLEGQLRAEREAQVRLLAGLAHAGMPRADGDVAPANRPPGRRPQPTD